MNDRHRMTRSLLRKALLAMLAGTVLGGTAEARGACDGVLTPYPGITIPADTRIADRRFGGISGVDFDHRGKRLVYISDERMSADAAVAFLSSKISTTAAYTAPSTALSTAASRALAPVAVRSLQGVSPQDGIDFEALRIEPRSNEWWIASEGGAESTTTAWIGRFDRRRQLISRIVLPAPLDAAPQNRSIESLAFDAQGRLWVALENALTDDGPQGNRDRGAELRIFRLRIADPRSAVSNVVARAEESLLYRTEPAEVGEAGDSDIGISEILRVEDTWWVIERAGLAGKDGRYRFRSRLFCAEKDPASAGRLRKTLLLDSAQLIDSAQPLDPLEANFEAMTIIPRDGLPPLLVIVNDNNFAPGVATRVLLWEINRP